MATIKINDLHPTGADLFQDSESYLNELTDEDLNLVYGGFTSFILTPAKTSSELCLISLISVTISTVA